MHACSHSASEYQMLLKSTLPFLIMSNKLLPVSFTQQLIVLQKLSIWLQGKAILLQSEILACFLLTKENSRSCAGQLSHRLQGEHQFHSCHPVHPISLMVQEHASIYMYSEIYQQIPIVSCSVHVFFIFDLEFPYQYFSVFSNAFLGMNECTNKW